MKRVVWAVLVLATTAACGTPVAGRPVAGRVVTPGSDAEVVRWMDNFCGVANYLSASGGFTLGTPPTDPAEAKKSLSSSLGRVVDVLNVAVHDLDELTPAPVAAADPAVEVILEPLSKARDKFVLAKSTVDEAPELTLEVFGTVNQHLTEAVTMMNDGVEQVSLVSLPDDFREAAGQAENCGK
ncbi:hypothetical protein [Saccharothrix variisporea]|uniref:hypothetical protein n=1 Tax=Saccharothrix variisporea TaxID=543527 RepID=UPI0011C41B18|nr:hypothetical protein [Saccharothrix variisporea]